MRLLYKAILPAFLLLASLSIGHAQGSITGKITDETGEAVIGGTVLIVGTSKGTATDFDGNYSLNEIEAGSYTIRASYTGYGSKEKKVEVKDGQATVLDFSLGFDEAVLDEVVVIGYGTVKKEDATGSVQSVDTEQFNRGSITGAQELLAGKIAGVQITTNSGAPGDGAVIRIRGGSSLSASNDPLIIVDGIPVDNTGVAGSRNFLNFINPNDIETFTVLKDASATAIYGSRASNGVILITTKKGKLGSDLRVEYTGNFSVSTITDRARVLDATEYRNLITDRFGAESTAVGLLGDSETNWQDEIYESALGTDHTLSLSGGLANILPYRLSLGYTNKKGVLRTDEFKRTTAALNLSPGFFDNTLQVNVNTKYSISNNTFANRDAIGSAIAFDPTQPVFSGNSDFDGYYTWLIEADSTMSIPNGLAPNNPVALLEQKEDVSSANRLIFNTSIDYRMWFLPDLRANLNLGYDRSTGDGSTFIPNTAAFSFNPITGGGTNNSFEETKTNELLEFYLNYSKTFDRHKIELMGGYSWQRFFFEKEDLNSDVAGTESETNFKQDKGELYLLSLFSRLNYSLNEKYLFTFTLRRDASSRFAPENRWGLFPAAAFAWKAVNRTAGQLTNLKFRLGYGVTGQQDIGDFYEHLPRYRASLNNAQYQFGDNFITSLRPEGYDANIKWEETTTYNIGVDYGLFNNRLYGSLEYYIRETRDLLNFIPVAAGTNLTNFIDTNVGDLENKGVEFSVNGVIVQRPKLNWEVGFNVTANTNEITKLIASDDPDYQGVLVGGISGGVGSNIQIHSVGFPANSYFVFEQVYDEAGNPVEGLYVDRNGDGKVSPEDMYRYEDPAPDFYFGFTSNLSYGNFSFSFAGRANTGNFIYNNIQSDLTNFGRLLHPTLYLQNAHPEIRNIGFENPEYFSDHFVQNGSFLRIDHVTFSYSFMNLMKNKGSLTLSATIQNPLLITNYSEIEPEINLGIDNNIYPRVRTLLFGVSASF
ncbi:MAG: SusC/RagA family TonB-linked outer membrane protein [Bacteroidota bacterium]